MAGRQTGRFMVKRPLSRQHFVMGAPPGRRDGGAARTSRRPSCPLTVVPHPRLARRPADVLTGSAVRPHGASRPSPRRNCEGSGVRGSRTPPGRRPLRGDVQVHIKASSGPGTTSPPARASRRSRLGCIRLSSLHRRTPIVTPVDFFRRDGGVALRQELPEAQARAPVAPPGTITQAGGTRRCGRWLAPRDHRGCAWSELGNATTASILREHQPASTCDERLRVAPSTTTTLTGPTSCTAPWRINLPGTLGRTCWPLRRDKLEDRHCAFPFAKAELLNPVYSGTNYSLPHTHHHHWEPAHA